MRPKRVRNIVFSFAIIAFALHSCGVKKSLDFIPDISAYDTTKPTVQKHNDSLFTSGQNYLTKNKFGQWEIYVEGNAFQRGLIAGALMDSLLYKQEHLFFSKVADFVPSEKKQKRLLKFLRWYNRKIQKNIPDEYLAEIYGLSHYSADEFDYVAPKFMRNLYLHGAHDIGHALVDMALVGCTSSALWDEETPDGKLILGRTLDFYLSDEFAEEKVLYFVKPEKGIPFVSVSWPGFMGVVSGMNLEGLTITMNAGKSKIPWTAKEPISIVARNILQHASTIEEAIAIAEESRVFVSEALMIGSAKDNKAVLIELSPKNFGVYEVINSRLVCSNHFQSEEYAKDKRNKNAINTSHSLYRFNRMNQLLDSLPKVNYLEMAEILRDKSGLDGQKIGYGNEKAINQLIAHHGIVFKPSEGLVWISTNPYQLGAFTAYDLNEIFGNKVENNWKSRIVDSLVIPEDEFIYSKDFKNYQEYRKMNQVIDNAIKKEVEDFDIFILEKYIALNPEFWSVYYKSGLICFNAKNYLQAKIYFEKANQKEITTLQDCTEVQKMIKKTNKKLK